MNILQIIQKPQLRGAEIFACQLSMELIAQGAKVDVAYLYATQSFDLEYDLNFISLQGDPERRFWDLKSYKLLAKLIVKEDYDLVQANAGDTLKYAVFSKRIFGWKAPIVFRNANKLTDFIQRPLRRIFNRWLLKNCSHFISVSENCRLDLVDFIPFAGNHSQTITIGTYAQQEERRKPFNNGEPIFVNVATLAPEKNHMFLLEVFHAFYQKQGKGYLWIIGDGKLKSQLIEKTARLSLTNQVVFWGYRKDAVELLDRADIMVMPSLIEGLPGSILEALAAGVPVVASAVGGIPEVIEDGVNGYCIAEWEVQHYVSRMEEIVQDDALRALFIKRGRETITSAFEMSRIARAFLTAYEDLIERHTNKSRKDEFVTK